MPSADDGCTFELAGVDVVRGGHTILEGVHLSLGAGERVALVGPSGGGKSTLVRLLVGLEHATRGSVRFEGAPVTAERVVQVRACVGYVIQEGGLFPHLTAAANIALPARVAGWDLAATRARIEELCRLVRLPPDALERYPNELSGGQRQRVALMRALCVRPRVLLLDEPLGALDPVIRHDLTEELRAIFEATRVTVLLVTHDLAEAAHLAHELVVVEDGRVVQRGSYAALRQNPATPHVHSMLRAVRASGERLEHE